MNVYLHKNAWKYVILFQIIIQKRRQSTFFGRKEALFLLTRAPALLNSLSAGTDVAHILNNFWASTLKCLNRWVLALHQIRGLHFCQWTLQHDIHWSSFQLDHLIIAIFLHRLSTSVTAGRPSPAFITICNVCTNQPMCSHCSSLATALTILGALSVVIAAYFPFFSCGL